MKRKMATSLFALILTAVFFSACAQLDVVKTYAEESMSDIAYTFQSASSGTADGKFAFSADGETILIVSGDYAADKNDISISTPLAPFLAAGLSENALPEGYSLSGERLLLSADYGTGTGKTDGFVPALFESVAAQRLALSYHTELDHFGISLGNGKFEFAKDYQNNDKDIVFVLNAAPLKEAGVDVEHVEGWVLKTMADENGKDIDLLLKPFDLGESVD